MAAMHVDVHEESAAQLAAYAAIPIAFEVEEALDLDALRPGAGAAELRVQRVARPYWKDYDALDGGPARWPERFDLSEWALFAAYVDGVRAGGVAVAFGAQELGTMAGGEELAVVWDVRVAPAERGRGIGGALLAAVERCARARGRHRLKVETQQINVPACRLYARHGFVLGAIDRHAYPSLPDEAQLLWYKRLGQETRDG